MPDVCRLAVDTAVSPPAWALMERELIRSSSDACAFFFDRYFDERGYLMCVSRWGGNDGPDDAIENTTGWPILHAVGGPESILEMYKLAWEGHLKQYTEARTVEMPLARDGMYYKEFPVCFDWFHNGEGLTAFNLQGLSDPYDRAFRQRVRRFAGFYMDEDPQALNYDPEHKIIRSMWNGSRGPLLRKATALDWAGDPIEVEHRFDPAHGERNFEEMLAHFKDYTDVVGDHPMNLAATTLALNAFMLDGEPKYKDWLLEYVDAWAERTAANNGIIPSNVGLDGTIGGECDGKWYGGCYGWGFTVQVPQTGAMSDRNTHYRGVAGFGNALTLTGEPRYPDVWRKMIATINGNAKVEDGQTLYPHMYGDEGWYSFTPQPYSQGALDVWYWSMDPEDLKRVPDSPWIDFLSGENPDFPVRALEREFETIRRKIEGVKADTSTPDTRLCDDTLKYNPAINSCLTQLMMGGLTPRHGEALNCRVRYFDPENRRAGIPADVAALVETLTADQTVVTLVNVNQVESREVIVQAGAYGEHQITAVSVDGRKVSCDSPYTALQLSPGAGARVTLDMGRYVNQPTFTFPWDR